MQVVTDDDVFDIELEAGEDFEVVIQHKSGGDPTNLTGYAGTAVVKTWARGATLLTFDVTISDAANGKVTVKALGSDIALMGRSGVFALKLTKSGGKALRVIWGRAHFSPGA